MVDTLEFDQTAGQIAELVKQSKVLFQIERSFDANKINVYQDKGTIPAFLVEDPGANQRRKYAKEAADWVVLATLLRRYSGDLNPKKIGKLFDAAIKKWGANQATLETLCEEFYRDINVPAFLRRLTDLELDLPRNIKDVAEPPGYTMYAGEITSTAD
jgi:hypothetical protein